MALDLFWFYPVGESSHALNLAENVTGMHSAQFVTQASYFFKANFFELSSI